MNASCPLTSCAFLLQCDPVDGTTNFVHGFPSCCVSLALAIKKQVGLFLLSLQHQKAACQSLQDRAEADIRLQACCRIGGVTLRSLAK